MKEKLRRVSTLRSAYGAWRRARRCLRHDVFLLSYPKCGRTWLRTMIGHYWSNVYGIEGIPLVRPDHMSRTTDDLPLFYISHDDDPQDKTPEEIETSKWWYLTNNVIFLVRDPRDVVVSMYYQKKERESTYDGSLSEFVYEPVGSIASIVRFYNVWARSRGIPRSFTLVRYEDIKEDAYRELNRVLAVLGEETVSERDALASVEASRFDKMREMELSDRVNSDILSPGEENRPQSYKTRRGKVGSFRDELADQEIEYLNAQLRPLNDYFGYP